MPMMSEPCRYFMPTAAAAAAAAATTHDNLTDYGSSLDQCRYYGIYTLTRALLCIGPAVAIGLSAPYSTPQLTLTLMSG